jgi:hypothetical protein
MNIKLPDNFWEELYSDIPKPPQPGEKTLSDIAIDLQCDRRRARQIVEKWVADKKLEYAGKRIVRGRSMDAWKPLEL